MEEEIIKETTLYELNYLAKHSLNESGLIALKEDLRKNIEEKKGLVIKEKEFQLKKLAYPVLKNTEAYFGWLQFVFPSSLLNEFKKKVEANENIIRFLLNKSKIAAVAPIKKKLPHKTTKTKPLTGEEIDKKIEEILS